MGLELCNTVGYLLGLMEFGMGYGPRSIGKIALFAKVLVYGQYAGINFRKFKSPRIFCPIEKIL